MNPFIGTGIALVTPFDEKGNVDYLSLEKLIDYNINRGINYLVALGTTAETPSLSKSEKLEVLKAIFSYNNNRLPIVIGSGGNNTKEVIDWISELEQFPHQGLLAVAPYYNKPSQEGMFQHFSAIAAFTTKPILLYNVPGRTSSNLLPKTAIRLANSFSHIRAIKEASGSMDQIMELVATKPDHFEVLSGDDGLTLAMMSVGAKGVVSVIAQAYPKQYSQMVNFCLDEDFSAARKLHYELLDITNSIYLEGNPTGIKTLLLENQIISTEVLRLPLISASDELKNLIAEKML